MPKVTLTWQDTFVLIAFFFGYIAMNADDNLFLFIYSGLCLFLLLSAVRSHKELSRHWKAGVFLFLFATVVYGSVVTYRRNYQRELDSNEGALIPAGDPPPLSTCPVPPGVFTIYSGRGAFWTNERTQVVVGNEQYTLLSVGRSDRGISVDALIYDEQQNLVARIVENKFIVGQTAFHRERPDRSTLIVEDRKGIEVLNVRLANQNAVVVRTAVLYSPDGRRFVTIKDGRVAIGKFGDATDTCAANGAFVFHI